MTRRAILGAVGVILATATACAQPPISESSPTPTDVASSPATQPTVAAPTPSFDSSAGRLADVSITVVRLTAGQGTIEAAAQVDGLTEEGGTCILAATSGATRLTVSALATADTQSTVCGALTLNSVQAGTWNVTVAYSSTRHYGISSPTSIGITS